MKRARYRMRFHAAICELMESRYKQGYQAGLKRGLEHYQECADGIRKIFGKGDKS